MRSDSQMQGDDFVIGALNVNAAIRAYQVCILQFYFYFVTLVYVLTLSVSTCKTRGHLIADTDPLGIQNPESKKLQGTSNLPPSIVIREHLKGLTEADMNREFPLGSLTVIGGNKKKLLLREIILRLNKVYCGHLGLEYTYIHDPSVVCTCL